MPPTLTLHQGDAQAAYGEHPVVTARKALMDAAEVEGSGDRHLASQLERFARALPKRQKSHTQSSAIADLIVEAGGNLVDGPPEAMALVRTLREVDGLPTAYKREEE